MAYEEQNVWIDVELKNETPKALLINDGDKDVWVPKSQVIDQKKKNGKLVAIELPEWIAKDKGLI